MTNYAGKTKEALVEMMKDLDANKELAKERMAMARTDAGKVLIEDMKSDIESLRLKYRLININRHTNIVVADLARLIGLEKGLIVRLEKWTQSKNVYEMFDMELKKCQKEITVRNKTNQDRSI